jgi:hypothetical protein
MAAINPRKALVANKLQRMCLSLNGFDFGHRQGEMSH